MLESSVHRVTLSCGFAALLAFAAACAPAPIADPDPVAAKIPVTTSSDEAHEQFLIGRDLTEKLRITDSHEYFERAIELDPGFALAHLQAGFTGSTAQEFWDQLEAAVAASGGASDGERLLILAAEAGAKGRPEEQIGYLTELVAAYPADERAHNALGAVYFGRQEYEDAIAHYQHAIDIDPDFSQPYNQKGYAHRFLGDYEAAEASFQKYVELIPNDPNPYDSYAELLMKMGRFDEAIAKYREALEQNPDFIASYIGIANSEIFMGEPTAARETLAELAAVARNDGERRTAHQWTARSYLHEGKYDAALAECGEMYRLAEGESDYAAMAGDLNFRGDILVEAGRFDEAAESYKESIEAIEQAAVANDVKENARRNILDDEARLALARGDLEGARRTAETYGELVAARKIRFEMRQAHELLGMIAFVEGEHAEAVAHLEQANQQDPRVLFLLARAHDAQGHADDARRYCDRAANFNALSATYAYVRPAAQRMLAEL